MPFITDDAWTPSTYRKAYAHWAVNAPEHDGPIMPREAQTASPRHRKLSGKLKGLMAWKHATQPDEPLQTSWMRYDLHADNDNSFDEHDEPIPAILDSETEIRPSINELEREWLGPKESPNFYRNGVAVEGDIVHGVQKNVPEYAASDISGERAPRRDRRIVTRIGRLEFSNGDQVEKCTVLKFGQPSPGEVRMPAGALVRYRGRKPEENFRDAKGSLPETEATVGIGGHNPGSLPCPDPVVDHEWAATIRKLVGEETARVLDLAITASSFREIGEAFEKQGKHAERVGKKMVLDACGKLDAILAANDNGWRQDLAA